TQLTRLEPSDEAYIARLDELGGPEENAAAEELPQSSQAAQPVIDAATTHEFVTNSDEVAGADEETNFEFNSVTEVSAPSAEANGETGFTFESIVAQELPSGGEAVGGDDENRIAGVLRPELESVDFYITQGYIDIAIDTLDLLQQQCGDHPEIDARRQRI